MTIRERIEAKDNKVLCEHMRPTARGCQVIYEWAEGNLIPRDAHEAAVREAVEKVADKADEIALFYEREARLTGLILNGRQRFAAKEFRRFAAAIRKGPE